jgi:hypothetical protein
VSEINSRKNEKLAAIKTEIRRRKLHMQAPLKDGCIDRRLRRRTDKYTSEYRKGLTGNRYHVGFPKTLLTTFVSHINLSNKIQNVLQGSNHTTNIILREAIHHFQIQAYTYSSWLICVPFYKNFWEENGNCSFDLDILQGPNWIRPSHWAGSLNRQHVWFVCERWPVWISAGTTAILRVLVVFLRLFKQMGGTR